MSRPLSRHSAREHVVKGIWALVIVITGLVIKQVLDPGAAQQVVGMLMSGGW